MFLNPGARLQNLRLTNIGKIISSSINNNPYMNTLKKIWSAAANEPLTVLFLLVLILSLVWHEGLRNYHFQECDSAGVYNMLYDFPHNAIVYTALTYPPGNILTPQLTQKILLNPTVSVIIKKYFSKYPISKVTQRISTLNVFALLRYGYIEAVNIAHVPHQLQGFFTLPLSSTYSAGPGLLYGLITTSHTSYESFMSRIIFLELLIFHLAVLLLYLTCRKLKINNSVSIIASLLFLFSISLYSSGYEAGSTLWIFSSEIFLLWIIARNRQKSNYLKKISYWTALLVFFNYLIIFLWAAALLELFVQKFKDNQTFKNFWPTAWPIIKSQLVAIIFIIVCAAVFYQPGQSYRGTSSLQTLPSYLYYIVLNFFSFYTHSYLWQTVQFLIGSIFILGTIFYLFKKTPGQDGTKQAIKQTLAWFFVIFWILILIKILDLVPTRHILFLSPLWFLGLAMAADYFTKGRFNFWVGLVAIVLICAAGGYSLKVRAADVYDRTASVTLSSDLAEAGVYDCSYNLVDKNWHSSVPVVFINPDQFVAGNTYLYLSQTAPFSQAVGEWEQNYEISYQILSQTNQSNPVFFIAYNPDLQRFLYSRPNSLFETKFKVTEISKKQ
jgi:hypothetical protein